MNPDFRFLGLEHALIQRLAGVKARLVSDNLRCRVEILEVGELQVFHLLEALFDELVLVEPLSGHGHLVRRFKIAKFFFLVQRAEWSADAVATGALEALPVLLLDLLRVQFVKQLLLLVVVYVRVQAQLEEVLFVFISHRLVIFGCGRETGVVTVGRADGGRKADI